MISVAIQNALVRTRSTYSRRTMAKVFFQFMRPHSIVRVSSKPAERTASM